MAADVSASITGTGSVPTSTGAASITGTAVAIGPARRSRALSSTPGTRAMSSKLSRSRAGVRRAAAGWYIANTRASRAPVSGSAGVLVPWTWPIRAPGRNVPIE